MRGAYPTPVVPEVTRWFPVPQISSFRRFASAGSGSVYCHEPVVRRNAGENHEFTDWLEAYAAGLPKSQQTDQTQRNPKSHFTEWLSRCEASKGSRSDSAWPKFPVDDEPMRGRASAPLIPSDAYYPYNSPVEYSRIVNPPREISQPSVGRPELPRSAAPSRKRNLLPLIVILAGLAVLALVLVFGFIRT